jgi:hypothetical protein
MDDNVRVEPEASRIAVPKVAGEPLVPLLQSEDSALANVVRRVAMANDQDDNYAAFGSATEQQRNS